MGTVWDFEMSVVSGKSINTCLDSLRKDRHSYRMLTKFVKDTDVKGGKEEITTNDNQETGTDPVADKE